MDVGLSMLVPMRECVSQGLLRLLSAILNVIAEYVVPTDREIDIAKPAVVTVSVPLRSVGSRVGRM